MLGALVRAAQACYDMALAYGTPFISGKDSLNNEFEYEGKRISIPHTLLISAMAVMEDVSKAVSMDFKQAGDLIYIVGATYNELGGSEYFARLGYVGNNVPMVNAADRAQADGQPEPGDSQGLVRACHDLSEGGLGVALAEMAFAGGLGADVSLEKVPRARKYSATTSCSSPSPTAASWPRSSRATRRSSRTPCAATSSPSSAR